MIHIPLSGQRGKEFHELEHRLRDNGFEEPTTEEVLEALMACYEDIDRQQ